jgi:ATP-dependent RNA helicase DeaD
MTTEQVEDENNQTNLTSGDYSSGRKFVDFPISQAVLQAVTDHGYSVATPIQAAAIEFALAGKDIVARAKTGTGKTAAFGIPMVDVIDTESGAQQGLVLAPTRELAQQIASECEAFGRLKGIEVAILVGGVNIGPQINALENGAQLVIGTPGRVIDHIKKGHLKLDKIRTVCLDEADEMLSMGFLEDVRGIIKKCPKESQILLFSATVSSETERMVQDFLNEPEQIYLSTDLDNVENISHVLYEAPKEIHKAKALLHIIDLVGPQNAIIFCNTRSDASTVASFLDRQGLDAHLLSGELAQSQRSRVMERIKEGKVKYLVATDVASRGIDISNLSHVINYMLPHDSKTYLHRIGRTGRLGKAGMAIALISGSDLGAKKTLTTQHGIKFDEREFPPPEECVRSRVARQAETIQNALGTIVFESYLPTVDGLLELENGKALLAAALRAFFQWDRQRRAEITGLHDTPKPKKDDGRGRGSQKGRDKDRSHGRNSKSRGDKRGQSASSKQGPPSKGRPKKGNRGRGRSDRKESSGGKDISDFDSLLSFD